MADRFFACERGVVDLTKVLAIEAPVPFSQRRDPLLKGFVIRLEGEQGLYWQWAVPDNEQLVDQVYDDIITAWMEYLLD